MNRFKALRKTLKLTQAEMAAALGVSQGNISFYENGQTVPPGIATKLISCAESRGVALTFDDIYAEADPAVVRAVVLEDERGASTSDQGA